MKETFSNKLVDVRLKAGLSQVEAANLVEISLRKYEKWEAGLSEPRLYATKIGVISILLYANQI